MKKTRDFESSLMELETVVTELDGEIKLERALELFEQGMKLSKECEHFLKSAQQKVEILKRSDCGEVTSEPFADEDIEDEEKVKTPATSKRDAQCNDQAVSSSAPGKTEGQLSLGL